MADTFMTTEEAGVYLRLSKSSLAKLRLYGGGPMFIRVSGRKIVYRRSDLEFWMAAREHRSTSEYARSKHSRPAVARSVPAEHAFNELS